MKRFVILTVWSVCLALSIGLVLIGVSQTAIMAIVEDGTLTTGILSQEMPAESIMSAEQTQAPSNEVAALAQPDNYYTATVDTDNGANIARMVLLTRAATVTDKTVVSTNYPNPFNYYNSSVTGLATTI